MSVYRQHGRKIKHNRKIYRRRKKNTALSIVITLAIAVVLVFVGYSVGRPVINFIKDKAKGEKQTTSYTPEVTTTEKEKKETTTTKAEEKNSGEYYVSLQADSLDEATLKSEVEKAKSQGCIGFAVVMKQQGGSVNYQSEVEAIKGNTEIIKGTMTAEQMVKIITDAGLKPVAVVDVLYDNLIPRANSAYAYKFENQSTTWLDDSVAKGGKPWMSPFADVTKTYITDMVTELTTGGFKEIVAQNVAFPPFRNSDLGYIGNSVKATDRYKVLTGIATQIKDKVKGVSGVTYLKVSAENLIAGKEEVYVPAELSEIVLMPEITNKCFADNNVTKETVTAFMSQIKSLSGQNEIAYSIKKSEFSADQLKIITDTLKESGITRYFTD